MVWDAAPLLILGVDTSISHELFIGPARVASRWADNPRDGRVQHEHPYCGPECLMHVNMGLSWRPGRKRRLSG
jgi:hypothetical protein